MLTLWLCASQGRNTHPLVIISGMKDAPAARVSAKRHAHACTLPSLEFTATEHSEGTTYCACLHATS
jgi:hypothetical protein